jgi:hypothetical protein
MEKEEQTRMVHEQGFGERKRLTNKPSQPLSQRAHELRNEVVEELMLS